MSSRESGTDSKHASRQNSDYSLMSSTDRGTDSKHASTQNSGYSLMSSTESEAEEQRASKYKHKAATSPLTSIGTTSVLFSTL